MPQAALSQAVANVAARRAGPRMTGNRRFFVANRPRMDLRPELLAPPEP